MDSPKLRNVTQFIDGHYQSLMARNARYCFGLDCVVLEDAPSAIGHC